MPVDTPRPQSEKSLRTFIAVELPEDVRTWIAGQQARVTAALSEAGVSSAIRMTPPGNLHLTLRFLGDTTGEQGRRLAHDLNAAALDWQPLTLRLAALGCFPNCRQPNIIWLGVEGDVTKLAAIQAGVERTVQQVGFAAETRPFSPHLTIGRAAKSASALDDPEGRPGGRTARIHTAKRRPAVRRRSSRAYAQ